MKTLIFIFLLTVNLSFGQSSKIEVVVNASESTINSGIRSDLKDTTSFSLNAIVAINRTKKSGTAIYATHGGFGQAVYANSVDGKGVVGVAGKGISIFTTASGSQMSVGVLGIGDGNRIGVEGYSYDDIGGYFSSKNGNIGLVSMNNVGVKTKTPAYPISFNDAVGDKISLYGGNLDNTTNHFGIGVQTSRLQIFTPTINDDILFGIGRSTSFTEKMRIKGNGSVGIGVTNPNGILDINGRLRIRHNGITAGVWMSNTSNGFTDADGAFYGMKLDTEAGIWIGNNWRFWVNNLGNATFTGTVSGVSFVNTSDLRFKKNIVPLKNALNTLLKIYGVRYDWRKDEFPERNFSDTNQIGFIAQEIEKIFPEMVFTDAKGYKSVDYARLTPVLVEAIKELMTKNEQFEARNNKLESRLDKIESLFFTSKEKGER